MSGRANRLRTVLDSTAIDHLGWEIDGPILRALATTAGDPYRLVHFALPASLAQDGPGPPAARVPVPLPTLDAHAIAARPPLCAVLLMGIVLFLGVIPSSSFTMAAFVPSGLPTLRGARGSAAVTCPASGLRMAAAAAADGATPVSRRRALQLMAFTAAAGGLLAPPAQAADNDMTTTASGLKYKVVKKGAGPKPVEGCVVCWLLSIVCFYSLTCYALHQWRRLSVASPLIVQPLILLVGLAQSRFRLLVLLVMSHCWM